MPFPFRPYAVPLACHAAKGLDCLFRLNYTVRPFLIHTRHAATVPCHHAVLKATSQARHVRGMGMAWHV
jgi:hypothetical protein